MKIIKKEIDKYGNEKILSVDENGHEWVSHIFNYSGTFELENSCEVELSIEGIGEL